ncbi:MAG: glycoside hydrolase family 15 protein [Pseudomonadota bacterium]
MPAPSAVTNRYRPIADYAAIGDCHGAALIAGDARIDWCCFRRFDAAPVFCRLLDDARGGFWSMAPRAPVEAERGYRPDTNIHETVFTTATGRVRVVDFMPLGRKDGAGAHDYVSIRTPHWLVRRVEALDGEVEMATHYRPSAGFERLSVPLRREGSAVTGEDVPALFASVELTVQADGAHGRFRLRAGESALFVLAATHVTGQTPLERVHALEAVTEAFWREWIAYCRYRGPHAARVRRSALALKLMTHAPSGALAAALTTSLPEALGGERNWDYRYSWLRDSCFTLYALAVLGYGGEARAYVDYLGRCMRATLPRLQIMYGLDGETALDEQEWPELDGYASSRPVRTGNGAYDQRQLDVYGQVLDLALLYERLGGRLGRQERRLLATLAEEVARSWEEPDQGLWEMRGPPAHHVHGKLMAWVAADRAAVLGLGDAARWRALADRIRDQILERGRLGGTLALQQAYERAQPDAATLLAVAVGFPLDDATLRATIEAVERDLVTDDLVHRYRTEDGLDGDEGAFVACSFWLVDAYLAAGRGDDARRLFDQLCERAGPLGLLAEEIEPHTGAFLGNTPQAFSHLALAGSAVNLELHRRFGVAGVRGTYADRAARAVGHVFGWRAIWAAMRACGRAGRLTSSRASVLLWP